MIARIWELIALFFKIGATSFGGPAVYIAIMEEEVVRRRQWLSREQFVDLLGATNLIPGPNATEVALYIGMHRAGVLGMLAVAVAYVGPSMVISGLLAWGYVCFGTLPAVEPYLAGIKPVVVSLLISALLRLTPTALKTWQTWLIGLGVMIAALARADEVASLFLGAGIGAVLIFFTRNTPPPLSAGTALTLFSAFSTASVARAEEAAMAAGNAGGNAVPLWQLGLYFLKIGAVLYGSGYVIVAYIEGSLVQDLGWLTEKQVMDAVAAGQITPGPFVSTASFIGYLLGGWPGVLVATVAINLPSIILVPLTFSLIGRMRQWTWTAVALDAVNAAALGLMGAVCVTLGRAAVVDFRSGLLAGLALAVLLRWKISPVWLVVGGAILGRLFL